MKIRTDFVTNSSSANYILEIAYESEEGKNAKMELAVSEETCFSDDGDMTASGDINLIPREINNDIKFEKYNLSLMKNIDQLTNLLFSTAKIEGWRDMDDYPEDDDDQEAIDEFYEGKTVSVSDVAPNTIFNFKEQYKSQKITLENLKTITIQNEKFGTGDSAMWIDWNDAPKCKEYKKKYQNASLNEKNTIVDEMFEFINSAPELPIHDNGYFLPDKMNCLWIASSEELKKTIEKYLNGKLKRSNWNGTYSVEYIIDVKGKTMSSRVLLLYGDI